MSMPLVESLKRLNPDKDRGVFVFYVFIAAIAAFLCCLPFSTSIQRIMMSKFHLTLNPFSRWAAAQCVPSMYNFKNEVFWSFQPQISFNRADPMTPHLAVNHYPMRMIFFTGDRRGAVFHEPLYIYLRSTYRGRELVTSYLLTSTPQRLYVQFLNIHERSER